ncbi:hypothetical protein C0993_000665 [Termitomyces sp. T159_Od127]|nr:hypothetical protein C0993_000665 [Termitomyces sp. T159_Od127]
MASQDQTFLPGFYGWTDTLKGVYYGPGSTKTALPKFLNTLGIKKALLVTGKSLYDKTDIVKKIESVLKEQNSYGATFYEIGQHSPIAEIRRGVSIFTQLQCDGIVAVGGGSPIDASKAILYLQQKETGGPTLSQIAIPTTLSAAEYSIGAGYTDDEGNKVAVSSQSLAPAGIILDAELTLATPERLWLSTGIRALDHAVGRSINECSTFISNPKSTIVETLYRPLTPVPVKVLCYAALADLFTYLPKSKANPQAVDCLTLAPTIALQSKIASQDDKELLAQTLFYLHQPSTGSVEGDILKLSSLVHRLVIDLGLQANLTEYSVPHADLSKIAGSVLDSQDDQIISQVVEMLKTLY